MITAVYLGYLISGMHAFGLVSSENAEGNHTSFVPTGSSSPSIDNRRLVCRDNETGVSGSGNGTFAIGIGGRDGRSGSGKGGSGGSGGRVVGADIGWWWWSWWCGTRKSEQPE